MSTFILPSAKTPSEFDRSNTSFRRQAPAAPLVSYLEREILLAQAYPAKAHFSHEPANVRESALSIGQKARQTYSPEKNTSALLPISSVLSETPFGTDLSNYTVSVRRGWPTRLVSRLAAHPTSFAGAPQETSVSLENVGDFTPVKAAPVLTGSVLRAGDQWSTGLAQPIRSSTLSRLLRRLAGVPVHLVRINALSLARFDFDRDVIRRTRFSQIGDQRNSSRVRVPTSARFLRRLEQERGSRFAAAPGRLSDLLRLGFVAVYLKSAGVRAQLLANSLARLPRNRKEIPFIRFRIKVVKVLSSARPERLGVRVSFKGRVARWNRTKILSGENGRLSLYTYSSRLERGIAQAITRKGTRGVRVWFCYHPSFAKRFRPTLLAFVRSGCRLV